MSVKTKILYGTKIDDGKIPSYGDGFKVPGVYKNTRSSFTLTKTVLSKHLLLVGGTGSGKTNAFNHIVKQIKENLKANDLMIVFDTKGDFFDLFFDKNKDMVIGNSARYESISQKWNIFKELLVDGNERKKIKENLSEISTAIFSDRLKNANEPFFPTAARDIFSGLLEAIIDDGLEFGKEQKQKTFYNESLRNILMKWSIQDFIDDFSIRDNLKYLLTYLGDGDNEQSLGVMAELLSVVNQLFVGVFSDKGMFSVREFVRNKGGRTLFIEYDLSVGNVLTPIYRLMIDLALKEAMSRNKSDGDVYLIFDEFKLLPNLKHIENAVNFGRSLGIKVLAGLQSIEQLYNSYGESTAKNIIGGFSSFFVFHANDFNTKEYFSKLYGKNLLIQQYAGFTNNLISENRSGNVIEDWDFNSLKTGEAIIGLENNEPFIFKFDLFRRT